MSPMAVDLLTGALRPLHSRAWNVQVDESGWPGCGSATAAIRWCSCPATAPTPIRCCSPTCSPSTTSPATTCSAGTTWVLAGRAAGQARGRRVHPPQLRRRRGLQARGAPVLRVPAGQAVQPGVVHGRRALAHRQAPAAALRAAGQRRRGDRPGPHRRRLPGAGVDHLRPAARGLRHGRRAGRGAQEGRGRGLARPLRPRPARPARLGLRAVRRADLAARRAGRRPRSAAGAAEGGVRGLRGDQQGDPGGGHRAGHPGAARRPGPRADAGPGPAGPRSRARLPGGARPGRGGRRAVHRQGLRRVLGARRSPRS